MARKRRKRATKKSASSRFHPLKIPLFLTLIGIVLIAVSVGLKIHNATNLSFSKNIPSASISKGTTQPVQISILSLGINLSVSETVINKGTWEISPLGASHLINSAYPGGSGNIIIYAHNTRDRFGKLLNIKKDDLIFIKSVGGKVYVYKVSSITIVNPDQIGLLLPTKSEVLTIYTCTGFADLKRFVVQAKPI